MRVFMSINIAKPLQNAARGLLGGLRGKARKMLLAGFFGAADWIDANQLGRRNLTPDQMSLIRGRRYNRAKKAPHRPEKRTQNEDVKPERTSERLAKEHGVSAATIKRDGQFAKAVEKVKVIE